MGAKRTKPAKWEPRFWAWLIDAIIIGIISWIVSGPFNFDFFHVGAGTVISFLYWTFLDSGGQSLGKKALDLKLVKTSGKKADMVDAAISAFGKAFLLPLDMIIGVLARPGKKQRLFNIASDTTVIKIK